jgi:hypothetical protein
MRDELVSYETAKLAKEKDFNIPQEHFYNAGSGWKLQSDSLLRTGDDNFIEAPTQSLLQRWLREKHNLQIVIDCFWEDTSHTNYCYVCWVLYREDEIHQEDEELEDEDYFNTYEQALEQGLQESLKLI